MSSAHFGERINTTCQPAVNFYQSHEESMQRSEDISELDAEVLVTQNMQKAKDIPVTSTQPCNLAQIDNRYSNTQQRFAGSGSTLLPSCIEPPAASRNALIA